MKLNFKPIEASDITELTPFFKMRPNKTCDSVFLDSFIWRNYYNVKFAISDGKALQWLMHKDGEYHSAMPLCAPEDLEHYFNEMVDYFNHELKQKFKIYLADEAAIDILKLDPEKFVIEEQVDLKDYLYDGDAMRTLSGKKLHKKKNHLNAFKREYEGRYEYRTLCCEGRQEIWMFLDKWRAAKGEDVEEHLDYEVEGIHEILRLNNCENLSIKMGGIYIDDKLEAFTIGSYNKIEDMAIIHIEKANSEFHGLYQFINQQFLIHEFPTVSLVNREDDLGIEGLRRAKMSYQPIDFARKYSVKQR